MQPEEDKLLSKKSLSSRVAAADELQKRLNHHSQNNRSKNDSNSIGQGRSPGQQAENQQFNSYLIRALIISILIAITLVYLNPS